MLKALMTAAAAISLFLPAAVQAQGMPDSGMPDTGRILTDPNYLPYTGQIYGFTDYTHDWTNSSLFDSTGARLSSSHAESDAIGQFLSYGITDDIEVHGSLRYVPDVNRKVDFANGTSAELNSSGFSDPNLGVVWRALDQGPASPVLFDLFASYSPDAFDAKDASSAQDGTVARGGQSGILGAAVGYETPQFGLRGAFNADFYGDSSARDLGTGDALHTQGYTDYMVSLSSQWRFNPLVSLNAGVDHTFATSENGANMTTGVAHVLDPGDLTALHASLNYHLVPNAVVVSALYTHDFYGNAHTTYLNPASDTTGNNKNGDMVGVRLNYVFP